MTESINDGIKTSDKQIVFIVALEMAFIISGVILSNWYAVRVGMPFVEPLNVDVVIPNSKFEVYTKIAPVLKARMVEQFYELRGREVHHMRIIEYYLSRYYSSIYMASILGLTAAVMLFFISNKGWAQADSRIIAIFIVSIAGTAFFSAIPSVFRQNETVTDNKNLYLEYKAVENRLLSFFATNEALPLNTKEQNKFIHQLDRDMEKLNNIAVGFDHKKIPKALIDTPTIFDSEDENSGGAKGLEKSKK